MQDWIVSLFDERKFSLVKWSGPFPECRDNYINKIENINRVDHCPSQSAIVNVVPRTTKIDYPKL